MTKRIGILWIAVALLAILAVRPYIWPETKASAQTPRFDYIYIISPVYLYQGRQGILLMDKRNGNVWFFGKSDDQTLSFLDPVLVVKLPFDKIDQAAP